MSVSVLDDGFSAAPSGPAQMPTLLNGYATRPSWHVAGVDYAVGPNSAPTKDPLAINMPGISINTASRFITISGNNITLDGYDFSLHAGYFVIVQGNNVTISNSKFVMGTNPSSYLLQGRGDNLTLKNNIFDGTSTSDNQSGLIAIYGRDPVIQYNWIKNFGQHALEMVQQSGVTTTLDYRFNLIGNGGSTVGAHLNFLQWGRGSAVNPIVAFNTTYQTPQVASGEGFQFNGFSDSSMTNALFANNTMITGGSGIAMSYLAHLTGGGPVNTGTARDNFFDTTSAYGGFYPVDSSNAWAFSSNYDLRTGALVSVPGDTQSPAPSKPVILTTTRADDGTATVTGSAEAGSKVTIYDGLHTQVGTATTNAAGRWTVTTGVISAGAQSLSAVASNATGNSIPSSAFPISVIAEVTQVIAAVVDPTAPVVTVMLTVRLNTAVNVSGVPTLSLNDGGIATYVSGSGTTGLTFRHVIDPSSLSKPNLAVTALNLPAGASILDTAGHSIDLSGILQPISGAPAIGTTANNLLNGEANPTSNTLIGLGGNDIYVVGAGDTIQDSQGTGDAVRSSLIDVDLANYPNIERIVLAGTLALSATGDSHDNLLNGSANSAGNRLSGLGGNDTYVVGAGDIVIEAAGAAGGVDRVIATVGYTLAAGAGIEELRAAAGSPGLALTGNELANRLIGEAGNDTLSGGAGDDTLIGLFGRDVMRGGAGADTFKFIAPSESAAGANRDIIADFSAAQGDLIDVSLIDANDLVPLGQAFVFRGTAAFSGGQGELRYNVVGTNVVVQGTIHGTGVDFEITLSNVTSLTAAAFKL